MRRRWQNLAAPSRKRATEIALAELMAEILQSDNIDVTADFVGAKALTASWRCLSCRRRVSVASRCGPG